MSDKQTDTEKYLNFIKRANEVQAQIVKLTKRKQVWDNLAREVKRKSKVINDKT